MKLFKKRTKIGLALGSGGAKGLVHIGVLKALVKNDIPIDFIAGCSMGAIIGGAFAAFNDIGKIEEILQKVGYRDLIQAFLDPTLRSGFVRGERVIAFLEKYLGKVDIEDLKIPFSAVSTDILTGKTIVFDKGNLVFAMRASGSVPAFLQPVKYKDHLLIDGGASQPVPVKTVKEMGSEKVIAVNLYESFFPTKRNLLNARIVSPVTVLRATIELLVHNLARKSSEGADILLVPDVPNVKFTKIMNGRDLIEMGEEAVEEKIDGIKGLLD